MEPVIRIFGCCLLLTCFSFGQHAPELFDEFENITGSVLRGNSLEFMGQVASNPSSMAVVVVSGPDESTRWRRRWQIENEFLYRQFDMSRVVFTKRLKTEVPRTELWKVPVGLFPPGVDSNWSYLLPIGAKPLILLYGGFDASEAAPPANEVYMARFLGANPGSRTNIVIRCRGRRPFEELRREVRTSFAKAGVPESKIRYYYTPIKDEYYGIEYWISP